MNSFLEFYSRNDYRRKQDFIIAKIAKKLKKLRIEKGFSSYENFAYENDIPRVQYWRMEKGTNFTIKNLLKILEVHGISIQSFFSDLDD